MAILLVKRSRTYVVIVQSITGFWLGKKGWQGGVVSYVINKTICSIIPNQLRKVISIFIMYISDLFIVWICCSTYSNEKPYCCCYVNKWIWTSYDLVSFNYWTGIATGKWFVVLVMLSHWSPWGKYGSWFWDQTCLSMLWEPSGMDRKLIWTWGSSLYYGWTWS